jgi:ankyrin repeat protein
MRVERLSDPARPAPRVKELVLVALPCALVAAVWLAAAIDMRLDLYYQGTIQELAWRGDMAGVQRALARGVSVDAPELGSGRTPLMAAARHGHVDLAKWLLSHGADVRACAGEQGTALQFAALGGNPEMVRLLLDHHCDPNALTPRCHETPLMAAAKFGQDDAARVLIAAGARVNARSEVGSTALMCAASGGYDDTVRLLLDAGADRAARDRNGETAADYAAHSGHRATAQLVALQAARGS